MSATWDRLAQPLAEMLERLSSLPPSVGNEFQAHGLENGFSIATLIIALVQLEGIVQRFPTVTPTGVPSLSQLLKPQHRKR